MLLITSNIRIIGLDGEIGVELMKSIPSLTKDVPIDHLNAKLQHC